MLTKLEGKILKFIGTYLREHEGQSPTLSEIGSGCGVKSVGTVHRYVASIENKGFLNRSRSGWRTLGTPTKLPFRGFIGPDQPSDAENQDETFDLASLAQPDCFIFRVNGESMIEKGIFEGDLAIIRSSETACNGDIVVALVDGMDASLREYKEKDQEIKLLPHNQNMIPMIYDSSQVEIQGILSSVIRRY